MPRRALPMTLPGASQRLPSAIPSARIAGLARAFAFVGLGLMPGLGCKAQEGDVCRCASDCRDGLVCIVEDREVLGPDECALNLEIGYCTSDEALDGEGGGLGDMPIFDDMPSKRDLPDGGDGDGDGDGDPTTGDGDGDPTTGDGDGDLTTGDGDGDLTTGDGDGDLTTGDGDGDLTTGDGDGDLTTGDGDGDLTTGDGDGDGTTGDGDGDGTTGDGDGDPP